MPGWLLAISRDSDLVRGLSQVLLRSRTGCQLWVVEDVQRARSRLRGPGGLPSAIVIDEMFLRGELLREVAEELAWFAPLILIARPDRQAIVALLVAAGKADFVARASNYIPLALALAERSLGRERAACEQAQFAQREQAALATPAEGAALKALNLVGNLLDNLDVVFADRGHLPPRLARRLDRAADIAFELKHDLRRLAGEPETELLTPPNR